MTFLDNPQYAKCMSSDAQRTYGILIDISFKYHLVGIRTLLGAWDEGEGEKMVELSGRVCLFVCFIYLRFVRTRGRTRWIELLRGDGVSCVVHVHRESGCFSDVNF